MDNYLAASQAKVEQLSLQYREAERKYYQLKKEQDQVLSPLYEDMQRLHRVIDQAQIALDACELCHKLSYILKYASIEQLKNAVSNRAHMLNDYQMLRELMPGCPKDDFNLFLCNRYSIDWNLMEKFCDVSH
jgi:hypothetical protein